MQYFCFTISLFFQISVLGGIVPHITTPSAGFNTIILIENDESIDVDSVLIGYDYAGVKKEISLTLAAGTAQVFEITELFGQSFWPAFVEMYHIEKGVHLSIFVHSQNGNRSAAHVRESDVTSRCWRVYPGDWSTVFDGFAMVNKGEQSTNWQIKHRQADGEVLQTIHSSGPLGRNQKQLFVLGSPSDQPFTFVENAYFEISSDEPTSFMALRGTPPDTILNLLWKNEALPFESQPINPTRANFAMIHFESGYKARLDGNLPVYLPSKYMTMNYGWQEYFFETAEKLVQKADDFGFHLTLAFNPQWAEYILLDDEKVNTVKQWQERGHEVGFHHHSINHPDWNGYSNDPNATNNPIPFLGNVDIGLDFVRTLAFPASVTTAMIGGLPTDMPQSYISTDEELIFAGGSQYSSFEQYGDLRSLKPTKVMKANGAKVIRVTHRQLTTELTDFTVEEALVIFKTEYNNMQEDEIYGIVFHCFDYHVSQEPFDDWFEFIKSKGDNIQTIQEVISNYPYDIQTE